MKQVYQKMELEHKIGPVGADGNLKPYAEYPKKVRRSDGRKITCKDQTEEVAVKMWAGADVQVDPVARERDELAQKLADAQARLAQYERGTPEAGQHPDGTPKDPAKAKSEAQPASTVQGTAGPDTASNKAGTDKAPAPSLAASAVEKTTLSVPKTVAQAPASPLDALKK